LIEEMKSVYSIGILIATFAACLNSNAVHATEETSVSVNEDFARFLKRQRQCGRPIQDCKAAKGQCMEEEDCLSQPAKEGFLFEWKEGNGLCKVSRKFRGECGCCLMQKVPTQTEVQSKLRTRMEGVGMGIGETEQTRLTFSVVDGEGMSNVGLMLGDTNSKPWSFKQRGGATAKVDCSSKTSCTVSIEGEMHSEVVDEIFPPTQEGHEMKGRLLRSLQTEKEPHHDGDFESQVVPATVELIFTADVMGEESIFAKLQDWSVEDPKEHQAEIDGIFKARVTPKPTKEQIEAGLNLEDVEFDGKLGVIWRPVLIEFDPVLVPFVPKWLFFERKRNLCVQPVRTKYRECLFSMFGICWVRSATYEYSGDGLAFGQPGANTEWGKVDITFTWRPWITIDDVSGKYQSVTEAEMADLRAEVSTDDCIEVFFVKEFSPNSLYGGGASWSSGTANNKVVSSDGNAHGGIDFTHLAHELGHSLGLGHPGSAGGGSTGTLLCPSGWMNDNPARNSIENGNLASNPLLTNYWGSWTFSTADCTNSADCGTCAEHM
jgi:hypothetical protein